MNEREDVIMDVANETDLLETRSDSSGEEYVGGGGKNSFHGIAYQINLSMFFILRSLAANYSFSVASEMKDAEKFDDVILRIKKKSGGYSYRLLQAKHKGGESCKNITSQGILSTSLRGDYSLSAYLDSYLKLKPRFTSGQDEIRDLIICTNGKLKKNDPFGKGSTINLEFAFEETDLDEIFQVKLLRLNKEGKRVAKDFLKEHMKEMTPSDIDLDSFLDNLHFVMDEFGNEVLKEKIKILLRKECCIRDIDIAYKLFENKIMDWLFSPKGTYLHKKKAEKFIQSLKDKFGDFTHRCNDPICNFIGRERELDEVEKVRETGLKNIVVISGLGGMGKTELARKFMANNSNIKRKIWITSDSQGSLINSFHELAKRLGISVEDKEMNTITEEIYSFCGGKDSVFVFDNVERSSIKDENEHYIKEFLPTKSNGPFVILTSKWQWNWVNVHNLLLTEIEEDDAKMFITSNLPTECISSDNSVQKLAKQVQNFPLALQQAVAYIQYKYKYSISLTDPYSIDDYLITFEKAASKVLNCSVLGSSSPAYGKTTMTTWFMTFQAIENIDDKAVKILNIIAHFAPDKIGIENIFLYFDETEKDEVKETLMLLKEFSVIGLLKNNISIHRLVQKVIILKLQEKGEYEKILRWILKSAHKLELEHVISLWELSNGHKKVQLEYIHIPLHIMQSLMSSSKYEQAYLYGRKSVAVLKEICEHTNEHLLRTLERFAWVSYLNMHTEEALAEYKDIFKRVIEKVFHCRSVSKVAQNDSDDRRIAKDDEFNSKLANANICVNSDIITDVLMILDIFPAEEDVGEGIHKQNIKLMFVAINGILKCVSKLGDNSKALILFQKVCEKQSQIFGESDKTTLATKHEIARLHSNLGDKEKALQILEEVYELRRKVLGEKSKNTLATKFEIANIYSKLGDKNKSWRLLEEVYEARKEIHGEDHEHTLATKHEIAMCHKSLGNSAKALKLLEEVYAKRREIVGESQKNTLATKYEIGVLYSHLGDKRKALMLLEEVYEKRIGVLGENHVNTLATKYEIAILHSDLGDTSEALMLLEDVYEKRVTFLGEKNVSSLATKHDIAMLHSKLGDKCKALVLFEEVFEKRIDVLGEYHENTLAAKHEMAMCHSYLGNTSKALRLLEDVYQNSIILYGENHENTLATKHEIAMCHSYLGDKTKALELLEDVYENSIIIFGEIHENTLATKHEIAMCHSYLGDFTKALELLEGVYENSIIIFGEIHENTLATKHEMAMCHSYLGDKTKALKLLEDVYQNSLVVFRENHENTLATKHEMAMCHSHLGDKTKALELLEDVYRNSIVVFGEIHENTLATKHEMAMCHSHLGDKTKALELLEDVYRNSIIIFGDINENTLATKHEMAMCHSHLGDKTKALELLEEVYENSIIVFGEIHENTLDTKQEMAMCHSHLGDKTMALSLLEEVSEKRTRFLGEDHVKTLLVKQEIAILHSSLGDERRALVFLEDVLEKRAKIFGENHEETMATKNELSKVLSNVGDQRRALILLEQVYGSRSEILGEYHELTLAAKYELAICHSRLGDKNKALILLEQLYEMERHRFGENHSKTKAVLNVITELKLVSGWNKCSLF